MFTVWLAGTDERVGGIGYWPREWQGEPVWETGWSVLPAYQGRGLAVVAARAVIEAARADGRRRWLHAYPAVDHPASNAICRTAGFTLISPCEFEYPKGHVQQSNDWRLDLMPAAAPRVSARDVR